MIGSAFRVAGQGVVMVLRAPLLVAGVTVLTAAAAVPFGLALRSSVQASLAGQPPLDGRQGDIDPEWWAEFRANATGLDATFTPAVLGAAAPLDALSALLDATPQAVGLAVPVAVAGLAWAWLWGGILDRFHRGRAAGPAGFIAAGFRHFVPFLGIAAAAMVVVLLLYVTLHPILFGPVAGLFPSASAPERLAFLWRLGLYAVFGVSIGSVGLVADYARAALVTGRARGVVEALRRGATFVRGQAGAVFALWALALAVNGIVLGAYVALELHGGARVGGWRAIAIGQAYIVSRHFMRLAVAASEVRLFVR